MAEVALAVMLVIGAGLMIRTVYNLSNVDAGFDRSRLVTFPMSLANADYPQPGPRAQLYQRLLEKLRGVAGMQGASAMSGLPPNRPLNANDTDIDNYTAPPEGPFENVDYYQSVMTDYFETMGIPIVRAGRSSRATRRRAGRDRERDAGQHVLEGSGSDRPDAEARLRPVRRRRLSSA